MKTLLYFIVTLCISCGCLIAATNTKQPYVLFAAAFGIWALFFWGWHRRLRKEDQRREQERAFSEFMRGRDRR